MHRPIITLMLLLSLNGCQDKEHLDAEVQAKYDAQLKEQVKVEVLAELEEKKVQENNLAEIKIQEATVVMKETPASMDEKNAKLNQLGIHMREDSITIDTNKTKEFFNDLSKKLDVQMKKISNDLKKGIIETKEAGVEINNDHIHIDLNKTQNMLQDWGKKIQVFVQEFDEITKNIENNDSNKGK